MLINEFEKLSLKKFKIKSILPDATILCLGRRRCFAKGTEVLMYDGSICKIEDIKVGDLVMGDDSTPRTVLEAHNGIDKLYKVTNKRGDTYTVNSGHILSLIYTAKKNIRDRKDKNSYQITWFDKNKIKLSYKSFNYKNKDKEKIYKQAKEFLDNLIDDRKIDLPIEDFLKLSKKYRNNLLGYQVPIEFPEQQQELPIDPYMIGYWLGDGMGHRPHTTERVASKSDMQKGEAVITCQDSCVLHYFVRNLQKIDCSLNYRQSSLFCYGINGIKVKGYKNNINYFLNILRTLKLTEEKHIPMIYKCNSRENRLRLLAGFIDADGHLGKRNDFEITQSFEHERLMDDIVYLVRSLGFSATKHIKNTSWTHNGIKKYGKAWRIHVNGEGIHEIPTLVPCKKANPRKSRVDALVSQIKVEEVNEGEYYGIELDGNHRYVLHNFICVHNSGKSFLVRDIFYHHRHIPAGLVFSGTEEASPFFGDFIPDCFIHSEYDPELIERVMLRQKKKIRETKMTGKSENGKLPENNLFIVLDDMLHDAQNWKKEKTIKNIFFNGRHYNFLFILTMQYPLGITPELRSNIDYVFIFNEPSIKNRKKIYDDYASAIPSFDAFNNILDACTQNHECLVIKTASNSTDLRDQVFWYKADAHTNFRVGHPKFWKYHNSHYNMNYEAEAEDEEEHIDKLKKKFAKTRKLKVIVSRKGDIVGYKPSSD